MKRWLIIFMLCIPCFSALSQGYRINLNSSNIFFNDFNKHKVYFTGFSTDLSFLIKRFNLDLSLRFYLPSTYYGKLTVYSFTDYVDKYIPVYARGGAFSFSYVFSYDLIKPKSEKFIIAPDLGILLFTHTGSVNDEPLIRIYGGSDEIRIFFFGMNYGFHFIYKFGYLPLYLRLNRTIAFGKRKYDDFKTSGYFQMDVGIAFPIMKSPPNSKINKITY